MEYIPTFGYKNADELEKKRTLEIKKEYRFDTKSFKDIVDKNLKAANPVLIVGDYDVDGVTSTIIMYSAITTYFREKIKTLPLMPPCDVRIRIPLRFTEGYGMKPNTIDGFDKGLIITTDNGIKSFDAISVAKDKGVDVILTDHHLISCEQATDQDGKNTMRYSLPAADCIINPHLEETLGLKDRYDFYDYCGAGIALKCAEHLLGKEHPIMNKMYALAALATICDVMPVVGDNRNIVIRGIKAMVKGECSRGLQQLLNKCGIDVDSYPDNVLPHLLITGDTLGYFVGPCVNAASRMADNGAMTGLKCLLAEDKILAEKYASSLIEINKARKEITQKEKSILTKIIKEENLDKDCPIVVHLPESAPGIIGLHAGWLCETYKVPAIVINGHGDNCKGSCRSPVGADMKDMLDNASDLLVAYGGHSGAAGLTIKEENIERFRAKLKSYCSDKSIKPLPSSVLKYDMRIEGDDIPAVIDTLSRLAPFGEGYNEPKFIIDFDVADMKLYNGKTLKLTGKGFNAIGYNMGGEGDIPETLRQGSQCSVYGTLRLECFKGAVTPCIQIERIIKPDDIIHDTPSHTQPSQVKEQEEALR